MIQIEIICHDGTTYHTEMENYDPITVNEQINNNEELTVVIGDIVVSRIDVKRIVPTKHTNEEENTL